MQKFDEQIGEYVITFITWSLWICVLKSLCTNLRVWKVYR